MYPLPGIPPTYPLGEAFRAELGGLLYQRISISHSFAADRKGGCYT